MESSEAPSDRGGKQVQASHLSNHNGRFKLYSGMLEGMEEKDTYCKHLIFPDETKFHLFGKTNRSKFRIQRTPNFCFKR